MFINGKEFNSIQEFFPEGLEESERRLEWSHIPVPGKRGAICADKTNLMNFVSQKMKGTHYLEIGTFDGITLSLLAEAHPGKEFIAIDPFTDGANTFGGCLRYFIENNNGRDNVSLYIGTSELLKKHVKVGLDFVFIDGDHSYEWVQRDISNVLPRMVPGGILAFHDFNMEEVRRAIEEHFDVNKMEWFGEVIYTKIGEVK